MDESQNLMGTPERTEKEIGRQRLVGIAYVAIGAVVFLAGIAALVWDVVDWLPWLWLAIGAGLLVLGVVRVREFQRALAQTEIVDIPEDTQP